MTWLRIIWEAFKRERRRQRMWKNRTAYTWHRETDYRDYTGNFRRENVR